MPPRKELCRNFQRGSCQYGDRCKFLHASASPQQSKTNPFGFGMQTSTTFQRTNQQQQMPNPFGFGVQNNNQLRGANNFGSQPNQFKPFENKWTRFSPINSSNASASRQSENQPQAANHKCTDSESCRRVIVEDLENEKPLWKLTCYGHNRNGPCDIVGDISCEELRALAYDDAKQGKSLQFIIERERSLLNSKLVEFQNLVQKPHTVSPFGAPSAQNPFGTTSPQNPFGTPSTQNPFGGGSSNAPNINNGVPPPASNFGQLSASLNTGPAAVPNYTFGQSSVFQNNSQPSNMFQMNNSPFNSSGTSGSQLPQQSVQRPFFGSASSTSSAINAHNNPFSSFANTQPGSAFDKQLDFVSSGPSAASSAIGQPSIQLNDNLPANSNVDDSIWTKAEWKWNVGEIPEVPPPDTYIH